MKGKEYLVHPPVSIKGRDAYKFYKTEYNGVKKNKITRFEPWLEVVNMFWKEVGEATVNSKAGVFVNGLGYIGIWMNPEKQKQTHYDSNKKPITIYNDHTDHHTYHISLFTDIEPHKHLRYFTMDRTFHQHITKRISKELKKGVRYILRHSMLKKIYNNTKEHAY